MQNDSTALLKVGKLMKQHGRKDSSVASFFSFVLVVTG